MTFRIELVADSTVKLTQGDGIYTVEIFPLFDVDMSESKEFLHLKDAEIAFDRIVCQLTERYLYQ